MIKLKIIIWINDSWKAPDNTTNHNWLNGYCLWHLLCSKRPSVFLNEYSPNMHLFSIKDLIATPMSMKATKAIHPLKAYMIFWSIVNELPYFRGHTIFEEAWLYSGIKLHLHQSGFKGIYFQRNLRYGHAQFQLLSMLFWCFRWNIYIFLVFFSSIPKPLSQILFDH